MSVTSLAGAFGFAPQITKATAGTNWYWYNVFNCDYGPIIDERPFPQEVGGQITPTGAYRAGAYAAGGIDFTPRLLDDVGWLLSWLLGEDPVTVPNNPVSGVNKHTWTLDGTENTLDWGTVHLIIPGSATLGIASLDNKVAMMRLMLPQTGLISGRLEMVGRLFDNPDSNNIFVEDPAGAGWTPSFEDFISVPISSKGSFTIVGLNGGAALPVTNVGLDFVNGTTTPAQEMIIGSLSPDDFTPIAKTITVRATYKWPNPDVYQAIVAGAAAGTKFTPVIFSGQAVIDVKSPGYITGTTPWELKFTLPKVVWQITNPRLMGANILMTDLIGTAIVAGNNFVVVDMFNAISSYVWPT